MNDKQANGHPCKYIAFSGGDWVPYGNSGAHLPKYEECDHPIIANMDEMDDCMDEMDDCATCPYYEPDPDFVDYDASMDWQDEPTDECDDDE